MGSPQLSPQDVADLVWFCRRLAAALQAGTSLLVALETIASGATPHQQRYLARLRAAVGAGRYLSDALLPQQQGSLAWKVLRNGEIRNTLPDNLVALADRLELEATYPKSPTRLQAYATVFSALGFLLSLRVPMLSALESAAESVPDKGVTDAFCAARAAMSEGASLAEAMARLAPDLPSPTLDMIGEAEEDGRLDFALSVVADYLFDQAEESAPASHSKEVSHG